MRGCAILFVLAKTCSDSEVTAEQFQTMWCAGHTLYAAWKKSGTEWTLANIHQAPNSILRLLLPQELRKLVPSERLEVL